MRGIIEGSMKKNPTTELESKARNSGRPRNTCTRKVRRMAMIMSGLFLLNRQEARPVKQCLPPKQCEAYRQHHDRDAAADAQPHRSEHGHRLGITPAVPGRSKRER